MLRPLPRRLQVSLLASGALQQRLRVKNSGDAPLEFTCALHTYFSVSGGWACGCVAEAVWNFEDSSVLEASGHSSAPVETCSSAVLNCTSASHAALLPTLQMWPMPAWWA